jgi:hypothetical protein
MIPSFTDVERTKNRPRKARNDTEKADRHMGIRSRRWALFATPCTDVAPIKIREDLPDASAAKTFLTDVHGTIVKNIIA